MLGKPFVGLVVALYDLLSPLFETAYDLFPSSRFLKFPFQDKKIRTVPDVLGTDRVEIAPAETKMVNGVQNIGLSLAVVAHQTVDHRVKFQVLGIEILIID